MLAMRGVATMRAQAVVEAERQRDDAHAQRDAAHEDWVETKQKLGALESLDERQRLQHRAEQEAAEQAEADDIVNGRRLRRRADSPNGEVSL
jgi:flagellar export protein FliJ